MEDVYRSAASVVLLKPADETAKHLGPYQILLLHKPRKKDAWQLPQGGCEGEETISQTAFRELQEEAGISGVRHLGDSEKFYKYDFPTSFRRFRPDHVCGQKIHFVFGMVPENVQVNVDQNEIDKYVWVSPSQIRQYVKRKEYLGLVNDLVRDAVNLAASL